MSALSLAGKGKAADDKRHLWPIWFRLIKECSPPVIFGEQVEAAIGWGWLDLVFSNLESEGYACGAAVLPACGVGAPHIRDRVWFLANARLFERSNSSTQQRAEPSTFKRGEDPNKTSGLFGVSGVANSLGFRREVCSQQSILDQEPRNQRDEVKRPYAQPWANLEWIPCVDGKARPVEPSTFPLAHGILGRVGRLRAYGNAIVPQVAAEFIKAAFP